MINYHSVSCFTPKKSLQQIFEEHLNWKAEPKVNSMDNLSYRSPRNNFKIFNDKLKWNAKPKVKTMSEVDLKTFTESSENRFRIVRIFNQVFIVSIHFYLNVPLNSLILCHLHFFIKPLLKVKILFYFNKFMYKFLSHQINQLPDWKKTAKPKVNSMDNINYKSWDMKPKVTQMFKKEN